MLYPPSDVLLYEHNIWRQFVHINIKICLGINAYTIYPKTDATIYPGYIINAALN